MTLKEQTIQEAKAEMKRLIAEAQASDGKHKQDEKKVVASSSTSAALLSTFAAPTPAPAKASSSSSSTPPPAKISTPTTTSLSTTLVDPIRGPADPEIVTPIGGLVVDNHIPPAVLAIANPPPPAPLNPAGSGSFGNNIPPPAPTPLNPSGSGSFGGFRPGEAFR